MYARTCDITDGRSIKVFLKVLFIAKSSIFKRTQADLWNGQRLKKSDEIKRRHLISSSR